MHVKGNATGPAAATINAASSKGSGSTKNNNKKKTIASFQCKPDAVVTIADSEDEEAEAEAEATAAAASSSPFFDKAKKKKETPGGKGEGDGAGAVYGRSPYGTWISEIMLQQTRVETVVGYWQRWMTKFPTVGFCVVVDDDGGVAYMPM